MNYYLYNESKKELSNPISEQWIADTQLSKLPKSVRNKTEVIHIPDIREGLKIYTANGKYYKTIIGSSDSVWFMNYTDGRRMDDIHDVFLKDGVIKRYINEIFDRNIEEYETGDKVEHIHINGFLNSEDVGLDDDDEIEI